MTRPSVLVTGGAGYIGAHTCKALVRSGYLPVVLDNLSTGHKHFVRWGPLIEADIHDEAAVLEVLLAHKVHAIIHFAGSAYVGESVHYPKKYFENNVVGSISLLSAALKAGCGKIVFSSSCAVYGEPDELPIRETAPLRPVNPYGASKQMVEQILSDFARAYDRAISLRYFNASGADPDGELGELRNPETHLIPRAMMAIQGHIRDFAVFGTDYATPDGTAIRDYIHVTDLADAHLLALQRLLAGGPGGNLNLGSGRGHSVRQVLEAIAAETGENLPAAKAARRAGDPPVLFADATRARIELGFQPTSSDLKNIVNTAWAWHQRAHSKVQDRTARAPL